MSKRNNMNFLSAAFSELARELTPKELAKALRSGIRREANRIKKKAQENAMEAASSHGLHVGESFRKEIRVVVPKDLTGFRVTALPKKGKGYKTKDHGFKPIAMWADTGTDERWTHTFKIWGGKRISKYRIDGGRMMRRKRKGHYTGEIMGNKGGPLKFMERTERSEFNKSEGNLSGYMGKAVMRMAKRKLKLK